MPGSVDACDFITREPATHTQDARSVLFSFTEPKSGSTRTGTRMTDRQIQRKEHRDRHALYSSGREIVVHAEASV